MSREATAAARRDLAWMLALVGAAHAASFLWGEIIPANGGLGVDGAVYAEITRDFPRLLEGGIDPLYAGRVFVPGAVHLLMRAAGAPFTDAGLIAAYQVWNALVTLLSVVLWHRLSGLLKIGRAGRWLGFLALYVNCAQLELHLYYPVLTDPTAFALALAMLTVYFAGRRWPNLVLAAAGAFTWPTLVFLGLALFVFPLRRERAEPRPAPRLYPLATATAAVVVAVAGLVFAATSGWRRGVDGDWVAEAAWGFPVLALAAALALAWIFIATRDLADEARLYDFRTIFDRGTIARLALAAGAYLATGAVIAALSAEAGEHSPERFLLTSLLRATQRPLVFYVMPVLYFGPVVVVALLHWKRIVHRIHGFGLGLTLYAALSAMLSIQPLPRQSITTLPLLALLVVLELERRPLGRGELWGWAAAAFVLSRAWMPVNRLQELWPVDEDFWYRVNYGKYFTDDVYLAKLAVAAALTAAVVARCRRRARNGSDRLAGAEEIEV